MGSQTLKAQVNLNARLMVSNDYVSASNYLNLTTHPKVVAAMIEATQNTGPVVVPFGRFRTMDIHLQAEEAVAKFKGVEASLIYSAGTLPMSDSFQHWYKESMGICRIR